MTVTASSAPALRVGVLDTDSGFLQVLGKRLERLGCDQVALGSAVPVERLVALRLNVLVVDLAVLGPQAWAYLERVAEELPALGVVVCTGRSTVAQRVRGLRLGADDWVSKPCHPEEVVARVEAVTRRRRHASAPAFDAPVLFGDVVIDTGRFQAYVGERSLELTRREFELLQLLADAEGRVLEREEVYQRVWGYAMVRGDRSVDVFVRKLRSKLEKASPGWRYIHTHFGVGYRFAAERAEPAAAGAVASSPAGAGAVSSGERLDAPDGAPAAGAAAPVGA